MMRAKTGRRGVSLVECLAAMTVMMIVAGVAALLIESLYHIERAGREHAAYEAAIARIAHAFRRDVRAFPEASVGANLTLFDPATSRFIGYVVQGDQVARFEWQGLVRTSHDTFALPPRCSPRFAQADEAGRVAVSLLIDRRTRKPDGESSVRTSRIEATLAADRRFQRSLP